MNNKVPPPLVAILFALAMWVVGRKIGIGGVAIPFLNGIAIVLALAGISIAVLAVRQFSQARTTVNPLKPDSASSLVTLGIFNKSRNPMYLGMLLLLIGWAVYLGSLFNIVLLILFVLYINAFQIAPEEAAMKKLFGSEFDAYCARVRRWI